MDKLSGVDIDVEEQDLFDSILLDIAFKYNSRN